jgi:hypothetical protein
MPLLARPAPDCGIEAGQDMSKPTEPNKPEEAANQEKCNSSENPALGQLAQARDKKAANRRKNVTTRTLTHTSTEHCNYA